jgi:hypothetical protein
MQRSYPGLELLFTDGLAQLGLTHLPQIRHGQVLEKAGV